MDASQSMVSSHEPNDLIFQELSVEELQTCNMAHQNNRMEKFKQRFEEGHKCYGHVQNTSKEVVTYFWVTTDQKAPFVFGVNANILNDQVYIWDCRVDESMRGQGLYPHGLNKIAQIFVGKTALIVTETKNIASHKGIVKSGFSKYKTTRFVRFVDAVFSLPKIKLYKSNDCITF